MFNYMKHSQYKSSLCITYSLWTCICKAGKHMPHPSFYLCTDCNLYL